MSKSQKRITSEPGSKKYLEKSSKKLGKLACGLSIMCTPPPLRGATPGAIGSGEGERSGVVGGEAKRLGVLKVSFGFGCALELCIY